MRISYYGIQFIKREEGEKLTGYVDSVGIPTIGVGHTGEVDGRPVSVNMRISKERSTELLMGDLYWVEKTIEKSVTSPLNQPQYDALCSLIFNIGEKAFKNSTLLKRLNEHNYTAAAEEFLRWKSAGNSSDLLLARRKREKELFLRHYHKEINCNQLYVYRSCAAPVNECTQYS